MRSKAALSTARTPLRHGNQTLCPAEEPRGRAKQRAASQRRSVAPLRHSRGAAKRSADALMSSNAWRRHCTEKQSRGKAFQCYAEAKHSWAQLRLRRGPAEHRSGGARTSMAWQQHSITQHRHSVAWLGRGYAPCGFAQAPIHTEKARALRDADRGRRLP